MFTGIIRELGTVESVKRSKGIVRFAICAPGLASRVQRLESVSINGVCLSVVDIRRPTLIFEVIAETQELTTLATLRAGDRVHLEPSLTLVDRLNGHILLGHVDCMGTVVKRRQLNGELVLEIRIPADLRRFLVSKGPVALDGVSLTVGKALTASKFTIHLIPETLRQTELRERKVGDRVNIELDYFAKLVSQFLANGKKR